MVFTFVFNSYFNLIVAKLEQTTEYLEMVPFDVIVIYIEKMTWFSIAR